MSVPQAIEGGRDDRPHKCVLKAAGSSSPIFFNAEISTFEIQNPHYAIAFSFTNQLFIRANQPTGAYRSLIAISVRVIRSSPTNPEGNNNLQNEKKKKACYTTRLHAEEFRFIRTPKDMLKCHRPRSLRRCDELTEIRREPNEHIKH